MFFDPLFQACLYLLLHSDPTLKLGESKLLLAKLPHFIKGITFDYSETAL